MQSNNSKRRRIGNFLFFFFISLCTSLVFSSCPIANDSSTEDSYDNEDEESTPEEETAGDTELDLFPFYGGAEWKYEVDALESEWFGTTPESSEDQGSFTMRVTHFDPDNRKGRISLFGKKNYLVDDSFTLPNSVEIRENNGSLEIRKRSGDWESTLELSNTDWLGEFMLVPDSYHPETENVLSMSLQSGTVIAEYDNTTEQYIVVEHKHSSSQRINSLTGLEGSSYHRYYNDTSVGIGSSATSSYNISIRRTGYSIPLPDGTLREGGEGATANIVYDWLPATGSEMEKHALDSEIVLYFIWPMDHETTEAALNITGGPFELTGSVEWINSRQLRWTPSSPLPAGEIITVHLDTGAESTAGIAIPQEFSFQFETVWDRDDSWNELTIEEDHGWNTHGEILWTGSKAQLFISDDGRNTLHQGTAETGFESMDSFEGYCTPLLLEEKPDGTLVLAYKRWNSQSASYELYTAEGQPGLLDGQSCGIYADQIGVSIDENGVIHGVFIENENQWEPEIYYVKSTDWTEHSVISRGLEEYYGYKPGIFFTDTDTPFIFFIDEDPGTYGGNLRCLFTANSEWVSNQVGEVSQWRNYSIYYKDESFFISSILGREGSDSSDPGIQSLRIIQANTLGGQVSSETILPVGEQWNYQALSAFGPSAHHIVYTDDAGIAYIKRLEEAQEYHRLLTGGSILDMQIDKAGFLHLLALVESESGRDAIYLTNRQ